MLILKKGFLLNFKGAFKPYYILLFKLLKILHFCFLKS
jgi:hypothetical protein